ncbi:MAG TPA: PilX N-terminal domain-containing pilus assembly protein [Gemmatimonadales bacterium]|nr:PilX N-terminal domain-containing pilus assembly protein [Gemmatimonadales bacterium]
MTFLCHGPRAIRTCTAERGIALPMVLLALVVLSVVAVTSIQIAGQQKQAGGGSLQSTKAFYAAEAGAHQVIAEWDSARYDTLTPNPGDSAVLGWRILPDNGAAFRAVFHRVDDGGDKLFSLTVEGSEGPEQAQRAIGVLLKPGFRLPRAAFTTRGTVSLVEDTASSINGNDSNPPGWTCDSTGPAVPAVEVSAGTSVSQGLGALQGNPTIRVDSTMDDTRFTQFGSYSYADLVAMADKTYTDSLVTMFVGPVVDDGQCATSASNNWGDPLNPGSPCADYFPIIHFSSPNNVQLVLQAGSIGQGILLFDSRLDQDATTGLNFYGLIISQKRCDFEHYSTLYGALLCSNPLNGAQQNFNHTHIYYSRCALEKATARLGGSGVKVAQGSWKELSR